jgi:hypothetical protein
MPKAAYACTTSKKNRDNPDVELNALCPRRGRLWREWDNMDEDDRDRIADIMDECEEIERRTRRHSLHQRRVSAADR